MPNNDAARQELLARLQGVVLRHGEKVAIAGPQYDVTYTGFARMVAWLCQKLSNEEAPQEGPVAFLLDRSPQAYAAMWAALVLGRPYVPLSPSHPASRHAEIAAQANAKVCICSQANYDQAVRLGFRHAIVAPEPDAYASFSADSADWPEASHPDGTAYILFTSGSTGKPKGVPVSAANLLAFVENLDATITYRSTDVCSQVCELSFDFSVHEIYLALLNGCTLCPARPFDLFNPGGYVKKHGITVWVGVPSLARVLLHNPHDETTLESLRLSIFNGEGLPATLARKWQAAAPRAEIWNSYGPTECTVAVSAQKWQDDPVLVEGGIVSIGTPFPDCETALLVDGMIVHPDQRSDGLEGELLLSGPQRFSGYLDPNLPSPFVRDVDQTCFYKTGDRVLRRGGRYFYLGRLDHQVKIGGHRIELPEIEHAIRRILGVESLAVIAYPADVPEDLILFLEGEAGGQRLDPDALGLPAYMVPRKLIPVPKLPTTPHGKLDRHALYELASESK